MLRYFGFAQQVGLELGSLMPEGLRHTMAFMSVMVTMSVEQDKVIAFVAIALESSLAHNLGCSYPFNFPETRQLTTPRIFKVVMK